MVEKLELTVFHKRLICALHRSRTNTDTCVITAHGVLSNKDSLKYLMLAKNLEKLGINVLRFDFLGCGESAGKTEEITVSRRVTELNTVIDYANTELGFNKIGLFGSSLGGYLAILRASEGPRLKTLVTLAAPYSMVELFRKEELELDYYGMDGYRLGRDFLQDVKNKYTTQLMTNALKKVKCPILIIHGDGDQVVPVEHARRLYKNLECTKELKIIKNADHIFSNPADLNTIIPLSVKWFQKYLSVTSTK